MSKRKRRLTRTETIRRQRISRALKRFYRKQRRESIARRERALTYERSIKRLRSRFDVDRREAQAIKRRAREDATTLAVARQNIEAARAKPKEVPPTPRKPPTVPAVGRAEWRGELFAFNVSTVEPNIPALLPRNETITATIEYYQPDEGEPFAVHGVQFQSGATNEEFFHDYYRAVREDYKNELVISSMDSERVIVILTQLDSQGRIREPGETEEKE